MGLQAAVLQAAEDLIDGGVDAFEEAVVFAAGHGGFDHGPLLRRGQPTGPQVSDSQSGVAGLPETSPIS